jgi:dihydrofolate reductase
MTSTWLELVAAVAANGVMGRNGQLPWHLPDDLRHFKSLTMGRPVIMGRRTFESIGRPLPGRQSIVVSGTLAAPPVPGVELARSLDDAIRIAAAAADAPGPAFVIGGAALYAAAIPRARTMHLTHVDEPVEGDVLFPAYDRSAWRQTAEVRHERDARHAHAFRFCTYERLRNDGDDR